MRQVRDLTLAEEGNEPVRVILADENWIQTNRIALQELAIRLDRSLEHPEELMPLWRGWFLACHPPGRRVHRSLTHSKIKTRSVHHG